jgi:hypothetical protein
MGEFEEKLRAAFDAEANRAPARPGLRQRVIANAVATPRRRGWTFQAWLTPPRLALAGAVAAVLVVAAVGIRIATSGSPGIAQHSATPTPLLAFGKLPAPALHPPTGGLGAGGGPLTTQPYFGPATMSWTGQLPAVPKSAPVYRFTLPGTAAFDAFASRLGARSQGPGGVPGSMTYSGPDGFSMFIGPDPVANEPVFILNRDTAPSGGQPLDEARARTVADAALAKLGLTPSWMFSIQFSQYTAASLASSTVTYQRMIQVDATTVAGEVDGNGDPSGLQVMLDPKGQVLRISGPLRLTEKPATYPLRAPSSAVNDALNAPPAMNQGDHPPTVSLTKAALVYTTVRAGSVGYSEPAYLFTGPFSINGYPYEKRVLVPALAPASLSP